MKAACYIILIFFLSGCLPPHPSFKSIKSNSEITRSDFREKYRHCEQHDKNYRFAVLPLRMGMVTHVDKVDDAPHHHEGYARAGCIRRPYTYGGIIYYCAKCQKNYRAFLKKNNIKMASKRTGE